MPFVPVPLTARVVIRMMQHGQQRQTVLNFRRDTGSITQPMLVALAGDVKQWVIDYYRQAISSNVQFIDVVATDVSTPNGQQAVATFPTGTVGADTGSAPAPGNATTTMSWRTAFTGRAKRGRTYVPGLLVGRINTDDTITSAYLSTLSSIAGAILFGISAGWTLGVRSDRLTKTENVIACVLDNVLDSQRRRLPGRGV